MLSERFVDDMLRDSHALRRAMRQCDVQDCLTPSSRAAKSNMGPVFRRGCTDNVCSLRFVSTLRDSAGGLNREAKERALRQRMRGTWNPSTRLMNSQRDILKELLQRQLELHGFAAAYEASRDALLKKQRNEEAFYHQQREKRKLSRMTARHARQQQEICIEESHMRQKLRDSERRKRASTTAYMFNEAFVLAANAEFAERQAIFQDFHAQHASIVSDAANTLQAITGLPHSVYQSLTALQKKEAQHRLQLARSHMREYEFLKTQLNCTVDHQLRAEISQVIAKEAILSKLLQIPNIK
ncbi:hypothetical protein TraAM80_06908 [Trypanosoma rangeli]|uniref:Uncharacterized protein n=1 Tax=Trypanosoma rangeli TaxID=5698 RepID=A0A3R7NEK1_TRYRA|nr:uncharacterized protein TraAM80_06908 [Trypanosoma rangeli]RNF01537.1 hypothetical protein TraAM80_06908 [Trypanosoma rangeli]|eukprot:RNF01537.1 hypothetical protein TraAM80_06908 [Trypanosoma rangeli]